MAIPPRHMASLMTTVLAASWAGSASASGDPVSIRKREADDLPVARGAVQRRRTPGSVASRRRKIRRRGQR